MTTSVTPAILEAFNKFRAERKLKAVKPQTLKRYISGGSGYERGLPRVFAEFLKRNV